jgi:hypothetical protein
VLDSTVFIVVTLIALAWLLVVLVIVATCRMAARSDAQLASPSQSPRRPRTQGTAHLRILPPRSDKFVTYR